MWCRGGSSRDAERLLTATFNLVAPVEPVGIAQELGVQVLEVEFDRDILGGLPKKPEGDPKIVLNQRDTFIRRRQTCAHELGHYVRWSARSNEYLYTDLRSRYSDTPGDPEEVYADAFAGCLLMPGGGNQDRIRARHE
jgi:Zn-dependent peptidase ImmA (M78 family)